MVSMIADTFYSIIDIFWIARLGYQAIAALTIVWSYFILVFAVVVGTGVGVNALVSRRFGEKKLWPPTISLGRFSGFLGPLALFS